MDIALLHEPTELNRSFEIGLHPSTLDTIRHTRVNVAIWRRTHPDWVTAELARWLEHAPAERSSVPIDFSADKRAASGCAKLLESIEDAGLRDYLLADMLQAGRILRGLSKRKTLHAQFGAAHTDSCRKLHVDYVRLRLITTYFGPGTEWLPDDAARRSVLDAPPACHLEANRLIAPDASKVRRARAGDVLVLKGERSAPGRGAIHRSPPIEARDEARVVLSLTAR